MTTENLIIAAGMLTSSCLGFTLAAILAAGKRRRIEVETWRAASRYYAYKLRDSINHR